MSLPAHESLMLPVRRVSPMLAGFAAFTVAQWAPLLALRWADPGLVATVDHMSLGTRRAVFAVLLGLIPLACGVLAARAAARQRAGS